jgi:hypothetical protein
MKPYTILGQGLANLRLRCSIVSLNQRGDMRAEWGSLEKEVSKEIAKLRS